MKKEADTKKELIEDLADLRQRLAEKPQSHKEGDRKCLRKEP
jgi:hypothetical protein